MNGRWFWIFYLSGWVLTTGHMAARWLPASDQPEFTNAAGAAASLAVLNGAFWPFYWATKVWQWVLA